MRATSYKQAPGSLSCGCSLGKASHDQVGDLQVVLVHHHHVVVALDAEVGQHDEPAHSSGRADGLDAVVAQLPALVAIGPGGTDGVIAKHGEERHLLEV